jgi:signal transduction histidine kinase
VRTPESGKIVLEDIEFDLRAVVEEVGEMMSFRAHSKALELITYIPHDLPTRLVGDSTRLRQVLINLGTRVPLLLLLRLLRLLVVAHMV